MRIATSGHCDALPRNDIVVVRRSVGFYKEKTVFLYRKVVFSYLLFILFVLICIW